MYSRPSSKSGWAIRLPRACRILYRVIGTASRRRTSSMAFSVVTVGPLWDIVDVEGVIKEKYGKNSILIHCLMKSLPSTGDLQANRQRCRVEMSARSRILDQLSLAHKSGRVDDAWARIRTWEPLREGILSPSPLTGLGYPRAAAQRPRSVKPFPSRLRPGGHQPRLFPVGLLRGGNGASMVQYFTKAFFDELAGRLNVDAEWGKKAAAIVAKIVLTCTDRNASFLLDIQNGRVAVHDVAPDVPADFKFEGTYEAWTQLGKGEKDFQGLVLGGRIRFRGSMPKVMALMGPLSRITQIAQQIPREF